MRAGCCAAFLLHPFFYLVLPPPPPPFMLSLSKHLLVEPALPGAFDRLRPNGMLPAFLPFSGFR